MSRFSSLNPRERRLPCSAPLGLNKHLRPDPTAQRCVELATQAPWNLRKRKEMACRLAAYMHRDAGWSVPVGLGCDLTECECQALLHCPPPPPGGAINTPAPSLLPRGAFPLSPPTGWLIGTRRWDIAIHACIPPGVCRADCRRRGNPPLPSRLNQPAGHSLCTFQRCFFIIISQLLNVPEIRNGSGNHSWKPSLVYSATRVFRSSARVW